MGHTVSGSPLQNRVSLYTPPPIQPAAMPPKRSESSQKLANQEGRILLALDDIKNGRNKSLRAAARLYDIPFSTLQRRATGGSPRADSYHQRYKLSELEEDSLVKWILSLDARGAAPRPSTIREMADILLASRGESPSPTVGVNWVSTFVKRRDELKSRYSRRYDY